MISYNELVDGRYRITNTLGHGGMADVYEANDIVTKKEVAIKIIRDDAYKNPNNVLRFEQEARAAAALNHPNIVRVINLGTYKDKPYIANELIRGQTLREALDFRTKFSYLEAVDIMTQLTSAIAHAHANNVIHRDIKPQNIFYMADGTIKLGDFGIAKVRGGQGLTNTKDIMGSVHYLAPEISQGKPASEQSDIYAMGVTFFELITGHVPFEDGDSPVAIAIQHIKEKFPSPKKYNPDCPKEIEKIIIKATRKDPRERYASALDMYHDLINIQQNPTIFRGKRNFIERFFNFKGE